MDLKNEQNFNDWMLDHQYLHDFTDQILNLK
jgi:phage antirepressor YoqD-like protein